MEDKVKRIEDLMDQLCYELDTNKVAGKTDIKLYGIIIGLEVALNILKDKI